MTFQNLLTPWAGVICISFIHHDSKRIVYVADWGTESSRIDKI